MRRLLPISFAVLAAAVPAIGQPLDLERYTLVDLTHPFNEATVYWPTAPSTFELERQAWGEAAGGDFYSSFSFCTPEHGGTHLDAPLHFAEGGASASEVLLDRLIAPAVVIDIAGRADADRNYRMTRDDVDAFERAHGRIAKGTIVLVRTGWSRFWPDRQRYLGDATMGAAARLGFPGIGEDAMRLLVESAESRSRDSTRRRSTTVRRRTSWRTASARRAACPISRT